MTPSSSPCPFCASPRSYMMKWNGYPLYRCTGCGAEAVEPLPTQEQLQEFYQGTSGRDMVRWPRRLKLVDRAMEYYIARCAQLTGAAPRRFLDLGGGVGYWSAAAQGRGVEACLMDFAEDCLTFAKDTLGVKWTVQGDIGRSGDFFEPATFDMILARHTVEHVLDPHCYVENLAKVIRPGGMLEIETPNVLTREQWSHLAAAASNYRVIRASNPEMSAGRAFGMAMGKAASGVNPPKHLWGFTPDALTRLLERHGFEVKEIHLEPAGDPIFDPLYYDQHALSDRKGLGAPYYFWERATSVFFKGRGQNLAVTALRK